MNKITIEIAVRQSEKKETQPICRCKAPCNDNTLQQVGEIMFKTFTGQYSPQQEKGVAGVIEALLRRHYEKRGKR